MSRVAFFRSLFYGLSMTCAVVLIAMIELKFGLFTEKYLGLLQKMGWLCNIIAGVAGVWLNLRDTILDSDRRLSGSELFGITLLTTFIWSLGVSFFSSVLLFKIVPDYPDIIIKHILTSSQMVTVDADMVETVTSFVKRAMSPIPMAIMSFVTTLILGCLISGVLLIFLRFFPIKKSS
jgi:hypothetical protein